MVRYFVSRHSFLPPYIIQEVSQPNNPLHGAKLEQIVIALEEKYGWEHLGYLIPINCFNHDPSVKSSLVFLRKTPWARKKVEDLYVERIVEGKQ